MQVFLVFLFSFLLNSILYRFSCISYLFSRCYSYSWKRTFIEFYNVLIRFTATLVDWCKCSPVIHTWFYLERRNLSPNPSHIIKDIELSKYSFVSLFNPYSEAAMLGTDNSYLSYFTLVYLIIINMENSIHSIIWYASEYLHFQYKLFHLNRFSKH